MNSPYDDDEAEVAERALFAELATLAPDDPRRARMRDDLITAHARLAEGLARRFKDRGEPIDDLTQVAMMGLIKAVDRFDHTRGVPFGAYATPTIVGEVKRHFRDRGWAIRVPRRLQELRASVVSATETLTHSLGHSPTVDELATYLRVTTEDVLDALESTEAYSTLSLDITTPDGDSPFSHLGEIDQSLELVESREVLDGLLARLPERERKILILRYFQEKTQAQIALEVGVSQMHVSRLLARSLTQLRTVLVADDEDVPL